MEDAELEPDAASFCGGELQAGAPPLRHGRVRLDAHRVSAPEPGVAGGRVEFLPQPDVRERFDRLSSVKRLNAITPGAETPSFGFAVEADVVSAARVSSAGGDLSPPPQATGLNAATQRSATRGRVLVMRPSVGLAP